MAHVRSSVWICLTLFCLCNEGNNLHQPVLMMVIQGVRNNLELYYADDTSGLLVTTASLTLSWLIHSMSTEVLIANSWHALLVRPVPWHQGDVCPRLWCCLCSLGTCQSPVGFVTIICLVTLKFWTIVFTEGLGGWQGIENKEGISDVCVQRDGRKSTARKVMNT